jgi:CHAT domain-containing protein/Tfp pilus assembly protein PilF
VNRWLLCLLLAGPVPGQAPREIFDEAERLRRPQTPEALKKAAAKYQEALEAYRSSGNKEWQAVTLRRLGFVYRELGECGKAIPALEESLSLPSIDPVRGEAAARHYLGLCMESRGEYKRAVEHWDQAASLYRKAGEPVRVAFVLRDLGGINQAMGEFQASVDTLNEAIALFRAAQEKAGESEALRRLAMALYSLGESQKAIDALQQSLPAIRAAGNVREEAYAVATLAMVHQSLGEIEKAMELHRQALDLNRRINNVRGEAASLHNIAALYADTQQYDRALDHFTQALGLHRVTGFRAGEGNTLQHIGGVLSAKGRHEEALQTYDQALAILREIGDRKIEATTLQRMGLAHEKQGNQAEALRRFEEALGLRRQIGDPFGQAASLHSIARVERDRGNLAAAALRIEESIKLSESLRSRVLQADLRATHLAAFYGAYELYIGLLADLHVQQPGAGHDRSAFIASEKVRARALAESMARLGEGAGPEFGFDAINQFMDSSTLLVAYCLGEPSSYAWLLSRGVFRMVKLPPRPEIERQTRQLREIWHAPPGAAGEQEKRRARLLADTLLGPFGAEVAKARRLLIVPDGVLHFLPFAALYFGENRLVASHELVTLPSASTLVALRRRMEHQKPAGKTVAVVADPVFEASDPRVRPGAGARPAEAGQSRTVELERSISEAGMRLDGARIPRLPFSRREAVAILTAAQGLPSTQALDFVASRETVMNERLFRHRIIHFATHGLLNNEHPERSGLILSMVDPRGRPRDGFLKLSDVSSLRLPAELVVLSACQTALGKSLRGEGVLSLARGFLHAGAGRVIASLWKVDDRASAELMKHFYQELLGSRRLPPAAALRKAQLELARQPRWQSPYYWAAFVQYGEWR